MSKFHIMCSCVYCKVECTVQSIKAHINKHHTKTCDWCNAFTSNKRFCSSSCAAQHNNRIREAKPKPLPVDRFEQTLKRFQLGQLTERRTIRKCLTRLHGYQCVICGISEWRNQPMTLIVDHVDGNAGNNQPDNLRLLCPNCNSQTPTFGGRNKGKGRKALGLKLS